MNTSKRDILKLLGIGAVGAISTETLATQIPLGYDAGSIGLAESNQQTQLRIAESLERLARAIRNGDAGVKKMDVTSTLQLDSFLEHEIRVVVELLKGEV
jgi:hypothetical protein